MKNSKTDKLRFFVHQLNNAVYMPMSMCMQ